MSVNYKSVVEIIDKEVIAQPKDGEFCYYGFEGIKPVPRLSETIKNEMIFPQMTGAVVGQGHYLGQKLMKRLFEENNK